MQSTRRILAAALLLVSSTQAYDVEQMRAIASDASSTGASVSASVDSFNSELGSFLSSGQGSEAMQQQADLLSAQRDDLVSTLQYIADLLTQAADNYEDTDESVSGSLWI